MDISNKKNRTELKSFFKKNSIPTESNFADLIDSMLNQKDDLLVKPANQPLSIVADTNKNALDIYTKIEDPLPTWKLRISDASTPEKPGFSLHDKINKSRLFIHETTGEVTLNTTTIYDSGALGIGTVAAQMGNTALVIRQKATETNRGIKLLGPPSTSGQFWIGSGKAVLEADGNATLHLMTNSADRLVISNNGNIGIAENNPTHKLHISSTTGVRQNYLYLSGNKTWSSLSFNAHHNENNNAWVFPDNTTTAVTLEMDHSTGLNQARFDVWTTTTQSKTAWALRLRILGDSGNVGIGVEQPSEKLEVNGNIKINGGIKTNFITQEDWIAPTLLNGWVYYGHVWNTAGYFKDSFGIVHLKGLIKNGSTGQPIFTLPAGYRPAQQELHAACTNSNTIGRIDIRANGEVIMESGSNVWISLDGITFRAAPVRFIPIFDPPFIHPPIN